MSESGHPMDTSGRIRRTDAATRMARALPLVVSGMSYAEVAAEVGVSERTVRRWATEDERFRAAIMEATDTAQVKAREAAAASDSSIADALERRRFWTTMMRSDGTDGRPALEPKDRLKASELLGKAGGDFVTRVEQSGPDGGPVQSEVRVLAVTIDVARELAQEGSGR